MNKRDNHKAASSVVRKQLAAEARRKRIVWGSMAGVLLIGLVGLITWMVLLNKEKGQVHTPANANSAGNAVVTGSGAVTVEDYIDFMCPHCKAFHDEAGPTIAQLLADKKITLVQHPVAYLDAASTTKYSTRSSAASGCASDDGKFNEYGEVLFANQPAEGSAGLSDDQLISLGAQAGLGDSFKSCVKDQRYVSWAKKVSDDATKAGITGTPTILVNGKKVQGGSAAILAAVEEASAAGAAGATPTPTPSES
jgi:protein-disulfide isomerase